MKGGKLVRRFKGRPHPKKKREMKSFFSGFAQEKMMMARCVWGLPERKKKIQQQTKQQERKKKREILFFLSGVVRLRC